MTKPTVLLLGGIGFIGRHVAMELVKLDFASEIRIVDKVLPSTAPLVAAEKEAFGKAPIVFKQSNLAHPASRTRGIAPTVEGGTWDYVICFAAETKFGQDKETYAEKTTKLAIDVAQDILKFKPKKFIYFSTAQVYKPGKSKAKEAKAKLEPWTEAGRAHLEAETQLKAIDGLNLIIVRPAITYGPGDIGGLTPRVIIAAVYRYTGTAIKFLWGADLRINTVHVDDVAAATIHLMQTAEGGSVFNLADKTDTSQGTFNKILENIFSIKTGFVGAVQSQMASLAMRQATSWVNGRHLGPWAALTRSLDMTNCILTPYLDQELLYKNHLCIDGSAIEAAGFTYTHPTLTQDLVCQQIAHFIEIGEFPEISKIPEGGYEGSVQEEMPTGGGDAVEAESSEEAGAE